jgi:hypothetical protein
MKLEAFLRYFTNVNRTLSPVLLIAVVNLGNINNYKKRILLPLVSYGDDAVYKIGLCYYKLQDYFKIITRSVQQTNKCFTVFRI